MAYRDDNYEYSLFGPEGDQKILRRSLDSSEDWYECPEDGLLDAKVAIKMGDFIRENPVVRGSRVIRAPENEEIASQLGLTADQLAERLAQPDQNQGTRTRIDENEFDAAMGRLGLSPDEARARFNGSFWAN